jgi:hypothetical protein
VVTFMGVPSAIAIGLSVGIPGLLTGIAAIVAVCRAEPGDLAEIVRALMKTRAHSSAYGQARVASDGQRKVRAPRLLLPGFAFRRHPLVEPNTG